MIKHIELDVKHPALLGTEAVSIIEQELNVKNGFEFLNDPENLRNATNAKIIVYAAIVNGYLYEGEKCPLTKERVGALMDPKKLDTYLLTVYATLSDDDIDVEQLGEQLKKKTLKKAV